MDHQEPVGHQTPRLTRPNPHHPTRLVLGDLPLVPLTRGEVLLRGGWGAKPGMFGRRDQASRPGPMALAVDSSGRVSILDQVNRRVARYGPRGRLLALTPLTGEGAATAEYLLAGNNGDLRVLALVPAPRARYWLHHLGANGSPLASVALDRSIA